MTFQLTKDQKARIQETTLIRDPEQDRRLFAVVENIVISETAPVEASIAATQQKLDATEKIVHETRELLQDLEGRKWDHYHKEFCRLGLLCNHKPPTENNEKEENR